MQSIHKTNNQIATYLIVAVLVTGVTLSVLDSIQKTDVEISPQIGIPVQDSTSDTIVSDNALQSIIMPAQGSNSPELIHIPN